MPVEPRLWAMDNTHPIDYDAVDTIVRMGRAGTLTPPEARMRLRQVVA
jgi:hypothetical protein